MRTASRPARQQDTAGDVHFTIPGIVIHFVVHLLVQLGYSMGCSSMISYYVVVIHRGELMYKYQGCDSFFRKHIWD